MAGRSKYTDQDRSRVYTVLASNDGNVKRTSRDTNVPEETVRRWKREFADGDLPPLDVITEAANDFVKNAERVRDLALTALESKIRDGTMKGSELITTIGVLEDKRRLVAGMATQHVEHQLSLPSAEDIRELLLPAIAAGIQKAEQREADVIETGEFTEVEPKALPA